MWKDVLHSVCRSELQTRNADMNNNLPTGSSLNLYHDELRIFFARAGFVIPLLADFEFGFVRINKYGSTLTL